MEKYKNFLRDYLTENNGKMDSKFIKEYLSTGAIVEYFISRNFSAKERDEILANLGTKDRVDKILNVYMNGMEGQDVSDCDFSSLTQEEFEMLRFDENTVFNEETMVKFHTNEILKRENTQIKNISDNSNMIHVAIIDQPIINLDDDPNLIINNYVDDSIPVTDSYHGRTAYSIFKSMNPNCVVHFFGTASKDGDKDFEYRANAVQDIIDYNNNCKDDSKKIKLISCSHNLSRNPKEKELIMNSNINVISADNIHNGDFFQYYKFNDKDVIPSFTEEDKEYLLEKYSKFPSARKLIESVDSYTDNAILVNANLAIDQTYENMKRHECDISISWGVPVIASYYAMALKENPNISYEEFHNICKKSVKKGTNILDEDSFIENIKEIKKEQELSSENYHRFIHDQKSDWYFSEQEIGKATINEPTENKDKAKEQVQQDERKMQQSQELSN